MGNLQPNVKIIDLQHNLMPFDKSFLILSDNGTRIDSQALKVSELYHTIEAVGT